LACATILFACAATVDAGQVAYSFRISEDLSVLRYPNNAAILNAAANKTQHTLMLERDMPYFELRNTSETALISAFNLSIGDLSKNFDWASFIEGSPGIGFSLLSPDAAVGNLRGDLLSIGFTDFGPGEFVRFRVALDSDALGASILQDFRQILYHLNGNDDSLNSMVNVTFSEIGFDDLVVSNRLPNVSDSRPMITGFGFNSSCCCGPGDYVTDSGVSGQDDPELHTQQVPEPSSFVLLTMGIVGFLLCYRWMQCAA
jgi:hypothetical protein